MEHVRKVTAWLLVLVLFAAAVQPMQVRAGKIVYRTNIPVIVDGEEKCSIPALDIDYENHMYISLTGLSHALSGTSKAFSPSVEKQEITITTGEDAQTELPEAYVWDEEKLTEGGSASLIKNKLFLDGAEKKYYSVIAQRGKAYDAFLPPISLAMMFDMRIRVTEKAIEIHTEEAYAVSADELERSGYLQGINALAAGDGTVGEIYYQHAGEEAFPIASTTKLMTYFVFMDAVSQGKCSLEDTAVISRKAAVLSNGPDGVISMKAGKHVPVRELLYGMLLPSSNECALVIAEHVAGSEEAFVDLMNGKAAELGLENAAFYNCNGLPVYEDQMIPAKMHNHMTAVEMFILAAALVDAYPQIKEITSEKEYHMDSFDRDIKNTNALLYNDDHVTGLKTGTTNKAGSCLVTCVSEEKDGETHDLITVVFGADGDVNRGIASEIMVRYAKETLKSGGGDHLKVPPGEKEEDAGIPQDPEKVMKKLLTILSGISFG